MIYIITTRRLINLPRRAARQEIREPIKLPRSPE